MEALHAPFFSACQQGAPGGRLRVPRWRRHTSGAPLRATSPVRSRRSLGSGSASATVERRFRAARRSDVAPPCAPEASCSSRADLQLRR